MLVICLLVFSGCQANYEINSFDESKGDFKINYFSSFSSSGGTRTQDIVYTVDDFEIVSCEGGYEFAARDGTKTEECSLESSEILFIKGIIEEYKKTGKMSDKIEGGYGGKITKWEIILE